MGNRIYNCERNGLPKTKGELMAREGKLSRIITTETIRLELNTPLEWLRKIEEAENGAGTELPSPREMREQIIGELVEILLPSGAIRHQGRVFTALVNRERKASTALGHGIAIPHVRTGHARKLAIGFARTNYPIHWDAPDKRPVDLFFVMVAPPYDDALYHRLWPKLAGLLQYEQTREALRSATEPGEIIRIIKTGES
ncbi:hypothetical protein DRQ36_10930 [bacterium]|nr:MAG: hypothetical protein DRQ36_10930 [bacterium]